MSEIIALAHCVYICGIEHLSSYQMLVEEEPLIQIDIPAEER